MKKVIVQLSIGYCISLLLVFGISSCSKSKLGPETDTPVQNDINHNSTEDETTDRNYIDYGTRHNEMILIYYGQSNPSDSLTLKNQNANFSTYIDSSVEIQSFLNWQSKTNRSIKDYEELFEVNFRDGKTSRSELHYQMEVLEILDSSMAIENKILNLQQLVQVVEMDRALDINTQFEILTGLNICIASCEYWATQARGLLWYVKDCTGALWAWNSGAAGVGAALGGGAVGAGAVIVGVAAVSSMIS